MRRLIIFLMMALISAGVNAQDDTETQVEILVTDEAGEPLPYASVKPAGKKVGVFTDVDGKASVSVRRGQIVEISYLGMKDERIKISGSKTEKVALQQEENMLDQVIVNGYQRTTKRRITGSVATVTADDLKDRPMANIDQLLQGKIAGVDVKALSGRPGESAKIRIRGTNTITGNADPLWVVDGVPLQHDIPSISSSRIKAGDFNDIFASGIGNINPSDIESVTVLKDASATAIYGSRAAGGVIVVTTKRGKEGRMRINYSANVSLTTSPPRDANLMNSKEKLAWEQELWDEFSQERYESNRPYPVIGAVGMIRSGYGKYAGLTKAEQDAAIEELGKTSTNWFEELFRNSISQSHYISLSGGSKKSTYYMSLGYNTNKGLVKNTGYNHYSGSLKVDTKPNDRVTLNLQVDASWQRSDGSSLNVNPFEYAYFANPYEKPYNEDGSYSADQTYWSLRLINGGVNLPLPSNGINIMREINNTSTRADSYNMQAIASMSVRILDGLTFDGMASFGYDNNTSDNINGKDTYAAWMDRPFEGSNYTSMRTYSSITQNTSYNTNYNLRGQLHFSRSFNDVHYFSSLFGAEIRGNYVKGLFAKRFAYDEVTGNSAMPVYPEGTSVTYNDLLAYANIMDGLSGQSIEETRFASFYFSADYVLRNRYVVSFTARSDGSNNFGSKEQFNPTGSLGLSWNVDQESFMKSLKPYVSSLSVRAAMGYTGNINKSVYPQLVMDYSSSFRRTNNDYYRIGYLRNAPNPTLRWEKTRDMKVSVDAGFFNERLHITGELYNRRTFDAVSSIKVPYTTGFSSQSYNTSTLENVGAELSVSATFVKTKDWRAGMSANIAFNRNKLIEFDPPSSGLYGDKYVGYPLGSIFSGKVIGIDPETGIYMYQARPDAVIETDADRRKTDNYLFYLGTENAPTNGGYSMNVGYKNLTLSIGGSFSLGGKIRNNIESPVSHVTIGGSTVEAIPTQQNDLYVNHLNVNRDVVNRWTTNNPRTDGYPRIIDAFGDELGLENLMVTYRTITSASMLENLSYFKIGSLALGYTFDKQLIRCLGIESLSMSLTVNNLATFTNYSGIDPETPGAVYPMARTFTFGVSVGL